MALIGVNILLGIIFRLQMSISLSEQHMQAGPMPFLMSCQAYADIGNLVTSWWLMTVGIWLLQFINTYQHRVYLCRRSGRFSHQVIATSFRSFVFFPMWVWSANRLITRKSHDYHIYIYYHDLSRFIVISPVKNAVFRLLFQPIIPAGPELKAWAGYPRKSHLASGSSDGKFCWQLSHVRA